MKAKDRENALTKAYACYNIALKQKQMIAEREMYMRIDRAKLVFELTKRDMKQVELANTVGISRATVNNICRGKSCSDEVANKIAKALNIDVTEIMEQ